jgi:predicted TIM-barrel fold metal-dependent hydrolase
MNTTLPRPQEPAIYNCHIHTFTFEHTPSRFVIWLLLDPVSGRVDPMRIILGAIGILFLCLLIAARWSIEALGFIKRKLAPAHEQSRMVSALENLQSRTNNQARKTIRRLLHLIGRIIPARKNILERFTAFLNTALLGSQLGVFEEIRNQYPPTTKFVVLPMNLDLMNLGSVRIKIDDQHDELLRMARKLNGTQEEDKIIYPFYTIHPEQEDLGKIFEDMKQGKIFGTDGFRGLKIYPNLGYRPDDPLLMDTYEVYKICQDNDVPIIAHCTPSGIWKRGLSELDRRNYGRPQNYIPILTKYGNLRICLAHFGGAEEWERHLKGRSLQPGMEQPWVKVIYDLIAEGKYPNLYTDISYTVFTPKVKGLYIDLVDYLKVMLSNENIRTHVLFGSDYYMVEREKLSEKEVSILLRSRLGEDLFFQIAHTNPRKFLGIG